MERRTTNGEPTPKRSERVKSSECTLAPKDTYPGGDRAVRSSKVYGGTVAGGAGSTDEKELGGASVHARNRKEWGP